MWRTQLLLTLALVALVPSAMALDPERDGMPFREPVERAADLAKDQAKGARENVDAAPLPDALSVSMQSSAGGARVAVERHGPGAMGADASSDAAGAHAEAALEAKEVRLAADGSGPAGVEPEFGASIQAREDSRLHLRQEGWFEKHYRIPGLATLAGWFHDARDALESLADGIDFAITN